MGHAFYLICPTLFWEFYEANGYRIVKAEIWQIPTDPALNRFLGVISYRPGIFPEGHEMGLSANLISWLCSSFSGSRARPAMSCRYRPLTENITKWPGMLPAQDFIEVRKPQVLRFLTLLTTHCRHMWFKRTAKLALRLIRVRHPPILVI